MVKIFIGNLPREATSEEIQSLFSQYGEVTECAIIKNYGFVHMKDRKSANEAIRNLHLYKLHGTAVNVEASRNKSQGATKLHVANIDKSCTSQDLRALFEDYGTVTECDIVKNYAFVHMANSDEAMDAIKALDNSEFQGLYLPHQDPRFLMHAAQYHPLFEAARVPPATNRKNCADISSFINAFNIVLVLQKCDQCFILFVLYTVCSLYQCNLSFFGGLLAVHFCLCRYSKR
ncbi:RNA-binding protein 4.3 isoform X2 [Erpetoichthys calabaricus]|uniref:RNA-binding protein 4.3 isoform X2 n=1 Tax=Erpetoichthys calabaricus TaxID=27687 RepID=UPI002233E80E|nr:RNA-binding protein 4.3 isoform X2 [Erpetoichthys calabaricus]